MEGKESIPNQKMLSVENKLALLKVGMREEGLEPPRREARDPKSRMSTSFITPALFQLLSGIAQPQISEEHYNDIF